MFTTVIGTTAAICTTLAFLPQVFLTLKTRNTSGISLIMYSIFSFGLAMWTVYGLILVQWPLIIANLVTLILAVMVLTMKLRFG